MIKNILKKVSDILLNTYPFLFFITVLASFFVMLAIKILPDHGMYLSGQLNGVSMYPLIKDNAIIVIADAEAAPFEDLDVDDVVLFRERTSDAPIRLQLNISGDDAESSDDGSVKVFQSDTITINPGKDSQEGAYSDDGSEYDSGKYILHKIVQINEADENSDRVLFTRGINNPEDDPKAVMESGYVGKLVWHMNGLAPVYWFLLEPGTGFLILAIVCIVSGCNLLLRMFLDARLSRRNAVNAQNDAEPTVADSFNDSSE